MSSSQFSRSRNKLALATSEEETATATLLLPLHKYDRNLCVFAIITAFGLAGWLAGCRLNRNKVPPLPPSRPVRKRRPSSARRLMLPSSRAKSGIFCAAISASGQAGNTFGAQITNRPRADLQQRSFVSQRCIVVLQGESTATCTLLTCQRLPYRRANGAQSS